MLILGLHDGHNTSCALLEDGVLLAALDEERFRRIKNYDSRRRLWGMPERSLRQLFETAGVKPGQVELVAVPFSSPGEDWQRLRRLQGTVSPRDRIGFALLAAHKAQRLARLQLFVRQEGVRARVMQVNHHLAHAAGALDTCGFEDPVALTLDGKGDLLCGLAMAASDRPRLLAEYHQLDSPGIFYSSVTRLLGYRPDEDEGKVTALSASGGPDPRVRAALWRAFGHRRGRPHFPALRARSTLVSFLKQSTGAVARDLGRSLEQAGVDRRASAADIAHETQALLEEVCLEMLQEITRDRGEVDLCLAGGVFCNVKLNKRLAESGLVRRLFVHPAMGDSGLAVGACLEARRRHAGPQQAAPVPAMETVFWGDQYSDDQLGQMLGARGQRHQLVPGLEAHVARLLARGKVVALFRGRMEYGPRALGHRSILCQATDAGVHARLNAMLGRDPVMPLAPAVLAEHADRCMVLPPALLPNAPFMTTAVDATPWMRRRCPGAVHLDGTVRPQLVSRQSTPFLHQVLVEYHRLTGVPCLINTSFNCHREPIVCSPEDALRTFRKTGLDGLVMGNYLVNPEE